MKVGICVAESLNVKKMKMLGVISARNVKNNQGGKFKLSSWNNTESYILES